MKNFDEWQYGELGSMEGSVNLYDLTVSELDDLLDELELDKTGLKADKIERIENFLETPEVGSEEPEVIVSKQPIEPEVIVSMQPAEHYTSLLWAGIKTVYACAICGRQEDSEDDMRLHVLTHYPDSEHENILNELVKDN